MAEDKVNYQPVAPDPEKSCKNCKHFETESEDAEIGKCFGHEVVAQGTCNFFKPKSS